MAFSSKVQSPSTNRIHPWPPRSICRTASLRAFSTRVPGIICHWTLWSPCFSENERAARRLCTVCCVINPNVVTHTIPLGTWTWPASGGTRHLFHPVQLRARQGGRVHPPARPRSNEEFRVEHRGPAHGLHVHERQA